MEEQRATNPTEEKTCSINDLVDNELRFRDMDLPKVSTLVRIKISWGYDLGIYDNNLNSETIKTKLSASQFHLCYLGLYAIYQTDTFQQPK